MDQSMIIRFENLPVEIFMEIFDYFTANQLYLSFSQLNSRIDSILKSLNNLILMVKDGFEPSVSSFFHSFKAIHIDFDHLLVCIFYKSYIIPDGHHLFQTYSVWDNSWYHRRSKEEEDIIRPDIRFRLQSLVLPATTSKLIQSIFTGEFPRLEICHLGECDPFIFPSQTTLQLYNLRQLKIRRQNGSELEKLLSICSSLIYLDFSCSNVIPPFVVTTHKYPFMKYLRLSRLKSFLFHDGQFDDLLSLFPNLLKLHLIVDQCRRKKEIIRFENIANRLCHRLARLKILDLRIFMTKYMPCLPSSFNLRQISELHSLFKYVGRCQTLLIITSHDFIPNYCPSRYVRPSSE
jgi:hypothetical protein